jgi:hypothetical protein
MFNHFRFIRKLKRTDELIRENAEEFARILSKKNRYLTFDDSVFEFEYKGSTRISCTTYAKEFYLTIDKSTEEIYFTQNDVTDENKISIIYGVVFNHTFAKSLEQKVCDLSKYILDVWTVELLKYIDETRICVYNNSLEYCEKPLFYDFVRKLNAMEYLNRKRIDTIIERLKKITANGTRFYLDTTEYKRSFTEYIVRFSSGLTDIIIPHYLTYFANSDEFMFTPFDCTDGKNVSIFYNASFGANANVFNRNYEIIEDCLKHIVPETHAALQNKLGQEFYIEDVYISKWR